MSLLFIGFSLSAGGQQLKYLWEHSSNQTIEKRISAPEGYVRVPVKPVGFQDWLRHLPLKPGCPKVLLYNGRFWSNQTAHFAVLDIDVGRKDLQQCADSVIRLRAEYLYSIRDFESIHFNFTSGDRASFDRYAQGYRPLVKDNSVRWIKKTSPDSSYSSFRDYLIWVFKYAGTFSLSQEMFPVAELKDIQIGDVFIQGGFPGHVVIVVDMAVNSQTEEKIFLLAQGFTPAMEMHILNNPINGRLSPWYSADFKWLLVTPVWIFKKSDLKRFGADGAEKN